MLAHETSGSFRTSRLGYTTMTGQLTRWTGAAFAVAAFVLFLCSGSASSALAQDMSRAANQASAALPAPQVIRQQRGLATICVDGAVNGLITISIAAATATVAPLVLPSYPVLLGIGLTVGCTVRVAAESLRDRAYQLMWGYGPSS